MNYNKRVIQQKRLEGEDVMTISKMQNLCRDTIKYISSTITEGMTLIDIRRQCEKYMLENGADSFWYWDIGAFIFKGKQTTLSISGKDYNTDDDVIAENDIITIDLSPQQNNIWGDYARTLIIENNKLANGINSINNEEWKDGLNAEDLLHKKMMNFANAETTFEELFYFMNNEIKEIGYINLDFLGNLGHSVEKNKSHRIYIEKGNKRKLSEVEAFTFEPHIALPHGEYGYKKENIYAFRDNKLYEL